MDTEISLMGSTAEDRHWNSYAAGVASDGDRM